MSGRKSSNSSKGKRDRTKGKPNKRSSSSTVSTAETDASGIDAELTAEPTIEEPIQSGESVFASNRQLASSIEDRTESFDQKQSIAQQNNATESAMNQPILEQPDEGDLSFVQPAEVDESDLMITVPVDNSSITVDPADAETPRLDLETQDLDISAIQENQDPTKRKVSLIQSPNVLRGVGRSSATSKIPRVQALTPPPVKSNPRELDATMDPPAIDNETQMNATVQTTPRPTASMLARRDVIEGERALETALENSPRDVNAFRPPAVPTRPDKQVLAKKLKSTKPPATPKDLMGNAPKSPRPAISPRTLWPSETPEIATGLETPVQANPIELLRKLRSTADTPSIVSGLRTPLSPRSELKPIAPTRRASETPADLSGMVTPPSNLSSEERKRIATAETPDNLRDMVTPVKPLPGRSASTRPNLVQLVPPGTGVNQASVSNQETKDDLQENKAWRPNPVSASAPPKNSEFREIFTPTTERSPSGLVTSQQPGTPFLPAFGNRPPSAAPRFITTRNTRQMPVLPSNIFVANVRTVDLGVIDEDNDDLGVTIPIDAEGDPSSPNDESNQNPPNNPNWQGSPAVPGGPPRYPPGPPQGPPNGPPNGTPNGLPGGPPNGPPAGPPQGPPDGPNLPLGGNDLDRIKQKIRQINAQHGLNMGYPLVTVDDILVHLDTYSATMQASSEFFTAQRQVIVGNNNDVQMPIPEVQASIRELVHLGKSTAQFVHQATLSVQPQWAKRHDLEIPARTVPEVFRDPEARGYLEGLAAAMLNRADLPYPTMTGPYVRSIQAALVVVFSQILRARATHPSMLLPNDPRDVFTVMDDYRRMLARNAAIAQVATALAARSIFHRTPNPNADEIKSRIDMAYINEIVKITDVYYETEANLTDYIRPEDWQEDQHAAAVQAFNTVLAQIRTFNEAIGQLLAIFDSVERLVQPVRFINNERVEYRRAARPVQVNQYNQWFGSLERTANAILEVLREHNVYNEQMKAAVQYVRNTIRNNAENPAIAPEMPDHKVVRTLVDSARDLYAGRAADPVAFAIAELIRARVSPNATAEQLQASLNEVLVSAQETAQLRRRINDLEAVSRALVKVQIDPHTMVDFLNKISGNRTKYTVASLVDSTERRDAIVAYGQLCAELHKRMLFITGKTLLAASDIFRQTMDSIVNFFAQRVNPDLRNFILQQREALNRLIGNQGAFAVIDGNQGPNEAPNEILADWNINAQDGPNVRQFQLFTDKEAVIRFATSLLIRRQQPENANYDRTKSIPALFDILYNSVSQWSLSTVAIADKLVNSRPTQELSQYTTLISSAVKQISEVGKTLLDGANSNAAAFSEIMNNMNRQLLVEASSIRQDINKRVGRVILEHQNLFLFNLANNNFGRADLLNQELPLDRQFVKASVQAMLRDMLVAFHTDQPNEDALKQKHRLETDVPALSARYQTLNARYEAELNVRREVERKTNQVVTAFSRLDQSAAAAIRRMNEFITTNVANNREAAGVAIAAFMRLAEDRVDANQAYTQDTIGTMTIRPLSEIFGHFVSITQNLLQQRNEDVRGNGDIQRRLIEAARAAAMTMSNRISNARAQLVVPLLMPNNAGEMPNNIEAMRRNWDSTLQQIGAVLDFGTAITEDYKRRLDAETRARERIVNLTREVARGMQQLGMGNAPNLLPVAGGQVAPLIVMNEDGDRSWSDAISAITIVFNTVRQSLDNLRGVTTRDSAFKRQLNRVISQQIQRMAEQLRGDPGMADVNFADIDAIGEEQFEVAIAPDYWNGVFDRIQRSSAFSIALSARVQTFLTQLRNALNPIRTVILRQAPQGDANDVNQFIGVGSLEQASALMAILARTTQDMNQTSERYIREKTARLQRLTQNLITNHPTGARVFGAEFNAGVNSLIDAGAKDEVIYRLLEECVDTQRRFLTSTGQRFGRLLATIVAANPDANQAAGLDFARALNTFDDAAAKIDIVSRMLEDCAKSKRAHMDALEKVIGEFYTNLNTSRRQTLDRLPIDQKEQFNRLNITFQPNNLDSGITVFRILTQLLLGRMDAEQKFIDSFQRTMVKIANTVSEVDGNGKALEVQTASVVDLPGALLLANLLDASVRRIADSQLTFIVSLDKDMSRFLLEIAELGADARSQFIEEIGPIETGQVKTLRSAETRVHVIVDRLINAVKMLREMRSKFDQLIDKTSSLEFRQRLMNELNKALGVGKKGGAASGSGNVGVGLTPGAMFDLSLGAMADGNSAAGLGNLGAGNNGLLGMLSGNNNSGKGKKSTQQRMYVPGLFAESGSQSNARYGPDLNSQMIAQMLQTDNDNIRVIRQDTVADPTSPFTPSYEQLLIFARLVAGNTSGRPLTSILVQGVVGLTIPSSHFHIILNYINVMRTELGNDFNNLVQHMLDTTNRDWTQFWDDEDNPGRDADRNRDVSNSSGTDDESSSPNDSPNRPKRRTVRIVDPDQKIDADEDGVSSADEAAFSAALGRGPSNGVEEKRNGRESSRKRQTKRLLGRKKGRPEEPKPMKQHRDEFGLGDLRTRASEQKNETVAKELVNKLIAELSADQTVRMITTKKIVEAARRTWVPVIRQFLIWIRPLEACPNATEFDRLLSNYLQPTVFANIMNLLSAYKKLDRIYHDLTCYELMFSDGFQIDFAAAIGRVLNQTEAKANNSITLSSTQQQLKTDTAVMLQLLSTWRRTAPYRWVNLPS